MIEWCVFHAFGFSALASLAVQRGNLQPDPKHGSLLQRSEAPDVAPAPPLLPATIAPPVVPADSSECETEKDCSAAMQPHCYKATPDLPKGKCVGCSGSDHCSAGDVCHNFACVSLAIPW